MGVLTHINIAVQEKVAVWLCSMTYTNSLCFLNRVIAADVEPRKLDLAKELGADMVVNTKETDIKEVGLSTQNWCDNPLEIGNPYIGTLINSEDPDEMPQIAAFHQGLHCLLRQHQRKKYDFRKL